MRSVVWVLRAWAHFALRTCAKSRCVGTRIYSQPHECDIRKREVDAISETVRVPMVALRVSTHYLACMPNEQTSKRFGVWTELRVIRQKDGHTLSSLATEAKISLSYLSDLENGRRWPNPVQIKKLAVALNVPMSVLERERRIDPDGNSLMDLSAPRRSA